MNVLHLLSWFPTPDNPTLGNFCIRQIESLPEDCHSVILSVYEDAALRQARAVDVEDHGRYVYVRVRFRAGKCPCQWLARLWRRWRTYRLYQYGLKYVKQHFFTPDFVHLHVAYPAGRIALQWQRRYGIPYLMTEHWTIYQPQNDALLTGRLRRQVVKIGSHASAILPVSDDLRRNMERVGIQNNYQVIFNVVNTDRFTLSGAHRDGGKVQLLHISTLRDEAKNFSGLLRVVERLAQVRRDFELHVIHDYPAPAFEEYVRLHQLADVVFFHGKQSPEAVADYFAKTDLFVLFSNFENLPCVIVESFASGVPVLSTRVGGIAEIVTPERGVLVEARDEDALFEQMKDLMDHYDDYDREAIRQYALKSFSMEEIGRQIYEQYKRLLKML
ncbi:MAG: glycosyltransferase [Bacteroidales bacterium]|nr:glycosyltransferase [Bacteroidales bacterium]